jgi:MFS family permease
MDTASPREFTPAAIRAALAAWLGMFAGPNSMVSASMSLFVAPLAAEFGLKRTAISAILLVSPWTTALFSPAAGRALDRFGLRRVLLFALLLFGVVSMARGLVTAPWQLALSFFLVSIASAMNSSVGYAKLVSLWFSRNRGLILGLAVALGAGAGSALMPQIVRLIIRDYNWRIAYMALGAFVIVIALPLMAFLLREPPRQGGTHSGHGDQADLPGMTRAEALKMRTFWFLLLAIFLASMALIGTTAHAVPMLTERGFSSLVATTAVSCFFSGGVVGQLTSGFIADRVNSSRIVAPYFAAALLGAMVVHTTASTVVLLSGAFVMGMGQGAEIAFAAYLTSRYFGLRAYGSIYALFYASSNVGIGVGLMAMGAVHDFAGSYRPMTYVFGVALAVSVVLVSVLGPYHFASRRALAAPAIAPKLKTA